MSVDKTHLATILELSDPGNMFDTLDRKYSASNAARLPRLSTQKNVGVMEKYESMLNLNAEIRVQSSELAFHDAHLINFLMASMPSTYESILDNLNMRDVLTLEEAVRALRTKETELTDIGVIKEESAHFAGRGGFRGGRGGRGGAGARTISRTPDGGYAVQGYSSRPAINCFHCKKDGHGWRDCTQYLATEEGKKWKSSDKGKLLATRGTPPNTIQELASLAVAVDEDESEETEICLSSTHYRELEAANLASDEKLLHSAYARVLHSSTPPLNQDLHLRNLAISADTSPTIESQSWHLDSACSRHLTSDRNVFIGKLDEASTKIECANGNFLLAQGVGKIKLSCLKEDGSSSSTTINDVLYVPNAKANLLSLGQLSEKGVDVKTTGAGMYLHRSGKTVMIGSRIGRVWLMNNTHWPMKALSAREVVMKAIKKSKNDICHVRLGHLGETYSRTISGMVNDMDGDPSKACFCEPCVGAKITRQASKNSMSEVTLKLGRVHMDLWGPSADISLQGNRYMWTATDQATGGVWTDFRPNKKNLLQSIQDWKRKAEAESKCQLQAIHIDRGGEFLNPAMKEWCNSLNIKWNSP